MKFLSQLSALATPAPDFDPALQRHLQVETMWIARGYLTDWQYAERLSMWRHRYHEMREGDFEDGPGVIRVVMRRDSTAETPTGFITVPGVLDMRQVTKLRAGRRN